jgi:hypothetical protein
MMLLISPGRLLSRPGLRFSSVTRQCELPWSRLFRVAMIAWPIAAIPGEATKRSIATEQPKPGEKAPVRGSSLIDQSNGRRRWRPEKFEQGDQTFGLLSTKAMVDEWQQNEQRSINVGFGASSRTQQLKKIRPVECSARSEMGFGSGTPIDDRRWRIHGRKASTLWHGDALSLALGALPVGNGFASRVIPVAAFRCIISRRLSL